MEMFHRWNPKNEDFIKLTISKHLGANVKDGDVAHFLFNKVVNMSLPELKATYDVVQRFWSQRLSSYNLKRDMMDNDGRQAYNENVINIFFCNELPRQFPKEFFYAMPSSFFSILNSARNTESTAVIHDLCKEVPHDIFKYDRILCPCRHQLEEGTQWTLIQFHVRRRQFGDKLEISHFDSHRSNRRDDFVLQLFRKFINTFMELYKISFESIVGTQSNDTPQHRDYCESGPIICMFAHTILNGSCPTKIKKEQLPGARKIITKIMTGY